MATRIRKKLRSSLPALKTVSVWDDFYAWENVFEEMVKIVATIPGVKLSEIVPVASELATQFAAEKRARRPKE